MNRRRIATGLVVFIAIMCAGAPIAFQIGKAEGAGRTPRHNFYPREAAAFSGRGTEHFWDCYRQVRLPALRQFDRMQDCRPPGEGSTARHAEHQKYRGPSRLRNGALSKALAASIAGGEPRIAGIQPEVPSPPVSLAMALDPLASPTAGPFAASPPPMPGNLIPPGFGGTFIPPGTPQDPEPPAVETPIPSAFLLLISGFLALGAVIRRRKAEPQGPGDWI